MTESPTMPVKAVLYARVSTKEQANEGFSLSAQDKLVTEYAGRRSIVVARRFMVPESANGQQERKTFSELLTYLRAHRDIRALLCEKVDRVTRNLRDAAKVDDWLNEDPDRQVHFVKQGLVIHKNSKAYEKFQWDIAVAMARQYSNNLSEEAKKGLTEKAAQGWHPGNRKRGYRLEGRAGHRVWVIDEREARFITRLFELYDSGEWSTATLGDQLAQEGWLTPAGTPIGKSEIHRLLKDPFYCGELVWKGRSYGPGRHEPLVSRELYDRVRQRIKKKLTGKARRHDFAFQDLLRCGECGRSVVAEMQKGHVYYHCTRYRTTCTQRKYTREEDLDAQFAGFLSKLQIKNTRIVEWIRKALKESHGHESTYHNDAVTELNESYKRLQRRLDALYDDKLDGKIDASFYDRKFAQYSEEQSKVLASLERHKVANVSYFELGANILELSQKAAEIYQRRASAEQKRSLLGFVLSNPTLKGSKVAADYAHGLQLLSTLPHSMTSGARRPWLGR